jgi:hypothetical protein
MRLTAALLIIAALASCDRTDAANDRSAKPPPKPAAEEVLDVTMTEFGDFEYFERMEIPERIRRWNGKLIRAVGYMNSGRQIRDVKEFELVMNRDSCCYGSRPKMNHFFQTTLKSGSTDYTSEPIAVVGRFVIEERWDGDWPLGLYWLKDAKVVK